MPGNDERRSSRGGGVNKPLAILLAVVIGLAAFYVADLAPGAGGASASSRRRLRPHSD